MELLVKRFCGEGVAAILARGASGSMAVHVGAAGIGFAAQVLLARVLGRAHYGGYAYVIQWVAILVLFCQMGLDRTSLRFLAVYASEGKWPLFRGLLRGGEAAVLGSSVVVGGALALAIYGLRGRLGDEVAGTFWVACLVLPLLALAYLRQAGLQALRHPAVGQAPILLLRPACIAVSVGALAWGLGVEFSGPRAMGVNLGATALALLAGSVLLWRYRPDRGRGGERAYDRGLWGRTALPLMVLACVHLLGRRVDVLMLGPLVGMAETGPYVAAVRLADLGSFGLLAVNAIAAPLVAESFAREDRARLQRILGLSAAGALAVALPVTVVYIGFGHWFLGLFGEGFGGARLALSILAVGTLGNVLTGSVAVTLTMTGRQKAAAVAVTVAAAVNAMLNVVLIPRYGVTGAATATAISYVFTNVLMLVLVIRGLGVNPTVLGLIGGRAR